MNPWERELCGWVGRARFSAARLQGWGSRLGPRTVEGEVEGASGEYVLARDRDLPWLPRIGVWHSGPDVGDYYVRATTRRDGSLILYASDADDARHYLVIVSEPERVAGWILGRDGKLTRYRREPPGVKRAAFFVPQIALQRDDEGAL